MPNWRNQKELNLTPEQSRKMVKSMKEMEAAVNDRLSFPSEDEIEQLSIRKLIARKKGNWYQMPKDLEN